MAKTEFVEYSIALFIGHTMGPQVVKSKMDVLEVWP